MIPGLMGLISFVFFVLGYLDHGSLSDAKDGKFNALFGLGTAIWATIFVESWKRV